MCTTDEEAGTDMKGVEGAKDGVDDMLRSRGRGEDEGESDGEAKGETGVGVGVDSGNVNVGNEISAGELGAERFAKGSSSRRSAGGVSASASASASTSTSLDDRGRVESVDAALVIERTMTEGVLLDDVRCLTGI